MLTARQHTDVYDTIMISIYLRRDCHENGMTLQQYADAVMAGTQTVLDHDEFVYQFGSIDDELKLVVDWAKANDLTVIESGCGIATVKAVGAVGRINALFGITLDTVTTDSRTYITHEGTATIPAEINSVVETVLGLDNSAIFQSYARLDPDAPPVGELAANIDPNLITSPTPVDLAAAYQYPTVPGGTTAQGANTCVGIVELGGGWTTQNLNSTFGRIGLTNPTVVDVSVDGGINDPTDINSSGEVMLDIYCVGATALGAKIAMYFAPNSFQGFIDTIIAAANDTVNNPSVISISWGTTDSNWFGSNSQFDTALQAAIVKGITTFVASGDFGVRAINGAPTYTVQYPGSSPYVICAGGTVVTINNDYTIASETAWGTAGGSYAGGGGVSTLYSVPTWQTGLTSKTYPTPSSSLPLTGRGIPDVSAMATGYTFYYGINNYVGTFLGTSAVAPLLSGLMARLNSITASKIGSVNSTWYAAKTTAFNDITVGDNHGGNTVGYVATAGWDACTGIGSPIGVNILALYQNTTGAIYPNYLVGTRPNSGQTYPRPYITA
jgi:kumamolisin